MASISAAAKAPYPPSRVIRAIRWAPARRRSSAGPREATTGRLTWADDDALYTAYGDGTRVRAVRPREAEPRLRQDHRRRPRTSGASTSARRPASRRATGQRARRPAGCWRSRASSTCGFGTPAIRNWPGRPTMRGPGRGAAGSFRASFGCPTFLNFGKDYAGARDEYVYVYSPDGDSAYEAADRMVLARVPKRSHHRPRVPTSSSRDWTRRGVPSWTDDIARRRPVFEHRRGCGRSAITL